MLKPWPLALSFGLATVLLYILFYLLELIAPPIFKLLLNSQFFGADIASQISNMNPINFLGILIAVFMVTWFFGYLVALLYNRWTR